jgi:hypothetical protein
MRPPKSYWSHRPCYRLFLAETTLSRNPNPTSSRPKAAHFAAEVERSLYFVVAVVVACCPPTPNIRHLDRRRRTLPPKWRDPCILLIPIHRQGVGSTRQKLAKRFSRYDRRGIGSEESRPPSIRPKPLTIEIEPIKSGSGCCLLQPQADLKRTNSPAERITLKHGNIYGRLHRAHRGVTEGKYSVDIRDRTAGSPNQYP